MMWAVYSFFFLNITDNFDSIEPCSVTGFFLFYLMIHISGSVLGDLNTTFSI